MIRKIVFVLLFLALTTVMFAEEADIYCKSVPIWKIYSLKEGYRIIYQKSNMKYGVFHVPIEWFKGAAEKGEIVLGNDPAFPYFSIFWEDGAFSHIRLYLQRDDRHDSWGELDNPEDYTDKFNIETLELDF